LVYLVGDGSGRLLGQRAYQHWSAPKFDRISARKALSLSDGLASSAQIIGSYPTKFPPGPTM
jgi:hypothetical protein